MLHVKAALVVLFVIANSSSLFAQESPTLQTSAVVLRYSKNIPLEQDDSQELFKKSIEILQSSHFNSSRPLWEWDEAKISLEYGRSVSGKHVIVTFSKPGKIKTIGGYISARELVIGLNGSHVASPVHTVDADGRVVGHAKYRGHLCIELMELVKEITAKSPNRTMEPTR